MNKDNKKILSLSLRYLITIIFGLSNLYLIYKILTPLTIHTTNLILKTFTPTNLIGNVIQFNHATIQIVPACVAGSAFYLLLVLFLSMPNISLKTRLKAISTALVALFIANVLRILILSTLISYPNFETIHWIFWHIISTVFVVAIYIATIRFYKIKEVPIISDIKYLKSKAMPKRKKHKKK